MSVQQRNVKVVVLGDIGRSPRMQYHSKSLAEMGHYVDIIGYGETEPMDILKEEPHILYHYLMPIPQIPIRLLNYAFKTIVQSLNLLFLLFITSKSDYVIMQNPPAIPAMVICWMYCKIVGAKFVIDWHNYAHTIMALSIGRNNPLVKIAKNIERGFGSRADFNFCVTRGMQDDLWKFYGVKATTLYDRPPGHFRSITLKEKHDFLIKCAQKYNKVFGGSTDNGTALTTIEDSLVKLKENRPGLLVSSTSWTEDEDFSVLLSALEAYEEHCQNGNVRNLPKLICAITGKGPLKEYYLNIINESHWENVTTITPWLESEDYPLLLASADLGVSLHTSSSGLDLPMKVVDMFGCGLPVCAFNFKCLDELVKNNQNGFVFSTTEELTKQIFDWFEGFPKNIHQQNLENKFKTELQTFQTLRWKENWNLVAKPIFK